MLKEKIIIVTGGSGLIGKEILNDINKKNGIAINADINVETDLSKRTLNIDITSQKSIIQSINIVFSYYQKIDGLVNNAYPRTKDWGFKFEDILYESWQQNVDMQMNSVFLLCQKTLAFMVKQKSGNIVNIASIYGVVGNDFTLYSEYNGTSPAAYSAIKGGIINLTRYLASYYGPQGIRINCVSPGGILDEKNQHSSFVQKYCAKVPMRRMGTPEDIAPAVSFMLSDEAKYITGQNLVVDGGWTII
jgi:NAD(P)-dependent dehydrogenase (short-subunit alcohol dehydrogenase family)